LHLQIQGKCRRTVPSSQSFVLSFSLEVNTASSEMILSKFRMSRPITLYTNDSGSAKRQNKRQPEAEIETAIEAAKGQRGRVGYGVDKQGSAQVHSFRQVVPSDGRTLFRWLVYKTSFFRYTFRFRK
jgi:hypothetical protein